MKYLLPPAFAVIVSTAGTIYGCHASGMPPRDVMIAGILAFTLSVTAACTALALAAGRSRRPHFHQGSPRSH